MRLVRLWLGASIFAGLWLGRAPDARAQDVDGAWRASSLRVSWAVGDWGEACGPRPSGGGEAGGQVTLVQSGNEFTLTGLGRSYKTHQCWEQMAGLNPSSHSSAPGTLKTSCKMPSGDPRQAAVTTTWVIRESTIYFDETGQYQLVAEKTNCTASVRRTRVLERVIEAPKPVAVATTPSTPQVSTPPVEAPHEQAPPAPAQATICDKPGSAVSLEVSPKTKLMRAGESFAFRAEARDAHGCRVLIRPAWSLRSGQELGQIGPDGTLTVKPDAISGPLTLGVRVDEKTVEVAARVVSELEYEQLLASGSFGVQGESLDRAVVQLTSSEVHVDAVENTAPARSSAAVWGLLVAAVAAAGSALFFVLRRPRAKPARPPLSEPPFDVAPTPAPSGAQSPAPSGPSAPHATEAPGPGKVCPVCARTYPRESTFCGQDGARLVRVN